MVGFLAALAVGSQFVTGPTPGRKITYPPTIDIAQWDVIQKELSLTLPQRAEADKSDRQVYGYPFILEPCPIERPVLLGGHCFYTPFQSWFSKPQIARIAQIEHQRDGIKALDNRDVARKLGLSANQKRVVQRLLHPPVAESAGFVKVLMNTPIAFKIKGKGIQVEIEGEDGPGRTIAEKIDFYDQCRRDELKRLEDDMATCRTLRKLLTPTQSQQLAKLQGPPMAASMRDREAHVLGSRFHPERLADASVQQELGLTRAQIQKLETLSTFWITVPDLAKILTSAQLRRFLELDLQVDGPFALLRHDIANRLQISEDVVDQMTVRLDRVYVDCYREADREWLAMDRGGKFEDVVAERRKVFEKYEAIAGQALLACLTPWQQARWQKMVGEPSSTMKPRNHLERPQN